MVAGSTATIADGPNDLLCDADDTIAFTVNWGGAVRNIDGGLGKVAEERWGDGELTYTLAASTVDAATPTAGGCVYEIASDGFPALLTRAAAPAGTYPMQVDPTLHPNWYDSGGTPPGVSTMESPSTRDAGGAFTANDGQTGTPILATTSGGYSCSDNDTGSVCTGSGFAANRANLSNSLLQVTVDAAGDITAATVIEVFEFSIFGAPPLRDSWDGGTFDFVGNCTNCSLTPTANDDAFVVVRDSSNNSLNIGVNDTGFSAPVTATVTVPPDQGGAAAIVGSPGDPSIITVDYTPLPGFEGSETFSYSLDDGSFVDSATVTITVDPFPDMDGDGVPDHLDPFPDDPDNWTDCDNDGKGDETDDYSILCGLAFGADFDGDGVQDFHDAFPFNAAESGDCDLDGIGDNFDSDPVNITAGTADGLCTTTLRMTSTKLTIVTGQQYLTQGVPEASRHATWDIPNQTVSFAIQLQMTANAVAETRFTHVVDQLAWDLSTGTPSATAFDCVEGTFGPTVGINVCGNYFFGPNSTFESTSSWGPGTATSRTLGGDDSDLGPIHSLTDYTADPADNALYPGCYVAFGGTDVEGKAWRWVFLQENLANPGGAICHDRDGDGTFDGAEDLPYDPLDTVDADGDGLGANREAAAGTDPNNPDSDGDGVTDAYEVLVSATDPNSADPVNVGPIPPPQNNGDIDGDGLVDIADLLEMQQILMSP